MNQLFSAVINNQPMQVRECAQYCGQTNSQGYTATMVAAQLNRSEVLREIRALDLYAINSKKQATKKPDLRLQHNITQETALMIAVKKNFYESAKVLLMEYGIYDLQQLTALAYAIINDNEQLVRLLQPCEEGCMISGFTLLQFCVLNERPQYFELFKGQFTQFSREMKLKKYTALMIAALAGKVQYVNRFAQKEAGLHDPGTMETCLVKVLKHLINIQKAGDRKYNDSISTQMNTQDIITIIQLTDNADCLILECQILSQFQEEKCKKDNTGKSAIDYMADLKQYNINIAIQ